MHIHFEENNLTAKQFLALRESVGWTGVEFQVETALKKGLYNVVAKDDEHVVGMARLVGDGVLYWYVQDVIVNPAYQGYGIGKLLMAHIMQHIEKTSILDTTVTIGLMAAKGKDAFYEKLGFHVRPSETEGAGMIMLHSVGRRG